MLTERELLKEQLGEFYENGCIDIFDTLHKYFEKNYKFPVPVCESEKRLVKKSKNLMYNNGYVTRDNELYYYKVPATNEEMFSIEEIINKYGYNFTLYNRRVDYIHVYLYKYFSEIDSLVEFAIDIKNGIGYHLSAIEIHPRDSILSENGNGAHFNVDDRRSYSNCSFSYRCGRLDRHLSFDNVIEQESYEKAIYEMFGTFICINNDFSIYRPCYPRHFSEIASNDSIKKDTKSQNVINELVKKPLPKVDIKRVKNCAKRTKWDSNVFTAAAFSKVEDGISVLRFMAVNQTFTLYSDYFRVYCVKDQYYACRKTSNGEWIAASIKRLTVKNFETNFMLSVNDEDVSGTTFKYYKNVVNSLEQNCRAITCISMVKEERIEQLCKIGLGDAVSKEIAERKNDGFNKFCHSSSFNNDQKDILKYLGVNKKQLDLIIKTSKLDTRYDADSPIDILLSLKYIFDQKMMSDIDIEVFEKMVNFSNFVLKGSGREYHVRQMIRTIRETNEDLYKYFVNSLLPILTKIDRCGYLNDYIDYIRMAKRIDPNFTRFKIGFSAKEDIVRMHQLVTDVYNTKKYEYQAKAFAENVKKVKFAEYSSSKFDFCVIAPNDPTDVAQEGIELRHCVKSYIPRITEGRTNIVFIRKCEEKDKPFFTVEIDNNNIIQQVHGFCNRNIDTEPGLDEFVKAWAKARKLKIDTINKVR